MALSLAEIVEALDALVSRYEAENKKVLQHRNVSDHEMGALHERQAVIADLQKLRSLAVGA